MYRPLRPDGVARCCHGAAHYLRYLLCEASSRKFRGYGLRPLVNSWLRRTRLADNPARFPVFMHHVVEKAAD